jgi:hypothetical protein
VEQQRIEPAVSDPDRVIGLIEAANRWVNRAPARPQRQSDRAEHLLQHRRALSVATSQFRDMLGERRAITVDVVAEQPPHV